MDSKQINPQAIVALKDALVCMYWYKHDLKNFLTIELGTSPLLEGLDWNESKRNVVQVLINRLTINKDKYRQQLINLMASAASMDDFTHLERLEDGSRKAAEARKAIRVLKNYTVGHEYINAERQRMEERRQAYVSRQQRDSEARAKLDELNNRYSKLVTSQDKQRRGYELEKLLNELFAVSNLDPKASFRITGEQIDGSFTFEQADYIFEAKWRDELTSANDLDSFAAKVRRKVFARGLFLSINGFTQDGITAHSSGEKVLLLMDGADLMAVLDGRIDLKELLFNKRRHAADTGDIYYTYRHMTS